MILSLLFASALFANDADRQDAYEAMLSCAAFHTIEATRVEKEAFEAQQATAYDFAQVAAMIAPDGKIETANSDLEERLKIYRQKLDSGDIRQMAEDWVALESACRELHPLKAAIAKEQGVRTDPPR